MATGNQIIPVRLPDDTIHQIDQAISRANRLADEPYSRSSWIRKAIERHLAHGERSRKPRPQKGPSSEPRPKTSEPRPKTVTEALEEVMRANGIEPQW